MAIVKQSINGSPHLEYDDADVETKILPDGFEARIARRVKFFFPEGRIEAGETTLRLEPHFIFRPNLLHLESNAGFVLTVASLRKNEMIEYASPPVDVGTDDAIDVPFAVDALAPGDLVTLRIQTDEPIEVLRAWLVGDMIP